jgi:hypothetical protein
MNLFVGAPVTAGVNDPRYTSLLQSLDTSIATFAQMRTPDSTCVAAFDALKQARALIACAFENERRATSHREEKAAA